jgi:predicted GIY-YIG superfamily endonuclease
MAFWTYMLRCADASFYTGHTDNLEHRIAQHQSGEPSCYTTNRRPVTLVWSQEFSTREEAIAAERQIKGWGRRKKEALIQGDWVTIRRLAWGTKHLLPDHLR